MSDVVEDAERLLRALGAPPAAAVRLGGRARARDVYAQANAARDAMTHGALYVAWDACVDAAAVPSLFGTGAVAGADEGAASAPASAALCARAATRGRRSRPGADTVVRITGAGRRSRRSAAADEAVESQPDFELGGEAAPAADTTAAAIAIAGAVGGADAGTDAALIENINANRGAAGPIDRAKPTSARRSSPSIGDNDGAPARRVSPRGAATAASPTQPTSAAAFARVEPISTQDCALPPQPALPVPTPSLIPTPLPLNLSLTPPTATSLPPQPLASISAPPPVSEHAPRSRQGALQSAIVPSALIAPADAAGGIYSFSPSQNAPSLSQELPVIALSSSVSAPRAEFSAPHAMPVSVGERLNSHAADEKSSATAAAIAPLPPSFSNASVASAGLRDYAQMQLPPSGGPRFSTAWGAPVVPSARALANACMLLAETDATPAARLTGTMRSAALRPAPLLSSGSLFSTGRGAAIVPSAESFSRARALLAEADAPGPSGLAVSAPPQTIARAATGPPTQSAAPLFSTGRGMAVVPSAHALLRARALLDASDDPVAPSSAAPSASASRALGKEPPKSVPLFSTGRGATIMPSAEALQRARALFDGDAALPPPSVPAPLLEPPRSASLFTTGRGVAVAPSAEALSRARTLLAESGAPAQATATALALRVAGPPQSSSLFSTGRGTAVAPSTEALARARALLSGSDGDDAGSGTPLPSAPFVRPQPRLPQPRFSGSFLSPALDAPSSTPVAPLAPLSRRGASVPKPRFSGFKRPARASSVGLPSARSVVAPQRVVLCERVRRAAASPRLTLADAILHGGAAMSAVPELDTLTSPTASPFSPALDAVFQSASASLANITPANAMAVVFDDVGAPRLRRTGSRPLNAPSTARCVVRAYEILVARGADTRIVTPAWTANAWRWAVTRAVDAERKGAAAARVRVAVAAVRGGDSRAAAADSLSGFCSWSRVLWKLIRRAQAAVDGFMSPLSRILAGDAPAAAHAVWLVVSTDAAPRSIEITDGWVACGGLLADAHVAALVAQGKIRVGTKIRVATSELVAPVGGGGAGGGATGGGRGLPPGVALADPCAALETAWNARWAADAWTALSPSAPPHEWTVAAAAGGAAPPAPFLTLRANSVRPAHWMSRLGPARVPHFLVSLASLVPGGGPAPALQLVVARRGPPRVLSGAPGAQRVVLTAEEAEDAQRAVSAAAAAALETRVGALEAAHEVALAALSKRAQAARSSRGARPARSQSATTSIYALSQGFSQDFPLPASQGASQGASQPGASQVGSESGARGGEAAGSARLIERLSRSLASARADAARGADDESRVVPFFTLSVLDSLPAHWAATRHGGGAPAARAPVSATLTVWRVSADAADAYAEGAIFTVTNVGASDADPDADGVPAGSTAAVWPLGQSTSASLAAPLPLPAKTRLATSRETVFRAVAAPAGGARTAAAAHDAVRVMLFAAADAAGVLSADAAAPPLMRTRTNTPSALHAANALSAPLSALVAAAAGFVPRACVPVAHAPVLSFATAAMSALAQTIIAATVPSARASAPDARPPATPTVAVGNTDDGVSARKRSRRRSTSSPLTPADASRTTSPAAPTAAHDSPPSHPRGSTLWRCFGGAPEVMISVGVAGALARAVSRGGIPRPSTAVSVDVCALVLRVSAARVATGAALRAARGPTPPIAWDVTVLDASGGVGVISFSTTLAVRAALTGCEWEAARDDLPAVAAAATAHAITPGATVALRDVAYRYWNTHERAHRIRWAESSAVAPRTAHEAVRSRSALSAWFRGVGGGGGAGAGAGSAAAAPDSPLPLPPSHTAIALLLALIPAETRARSTAAFADALATNGALVAAAHRAALTAGAPCPPPLIAPLPLLGGAPPVAFRAPGRA
jgi:hypothetical protein